MSEALPLNLLVAYPYATPDVIELIRTRKEDIRFVLDSGAFTAWKAGKPIALDDYCKFIESLPITPWRYFSLDVIGDAKGTWKNYNQMLKRGFKPVPIFTRGEDPGLLDEYYKSSDVVGIGGLVGTIGNKGFLKGIMRKIGNRRVHWLGFTNLDFLKAFKPYMADSSSWEMGARFAVSPLYLGQGQGLLKIMKSKIKLQLRNPQVIDTLQGYGLNPNDLLDEKKWAGGRSISRIMGARSYRRLSDDLMRSTGTHLFLATTTKYAIELLLEGQ